MTKGESITEVQGVEILKRYDLSNGEELETKYYVKNNCINTGDALNAFLQKLEQVYTGAKLIINPKTNKPYPGTRRLIELGELRNTIVERADGRINNGRKTTEDELILDQYIFNRLLELRELKPLPYRAWVTRVSLFDVSQLSDRDFIGQLLESINEVHANTLGHSSDVANKIVNNFINMMYKRNYSIIKNGFNRLETLGKIKLTNSYHVRMVNGDYKLITEKLFLQLKSEENATLDMLEVNKDDYNLMKRKEKQRDTKYYEINATITNHLKEVHEIQYYFEGKYVKVLDKAPYDDIDIFDMKIAYKKILLGLTIARENREDYKNTGDITKEWYTLNTFILLREMGIDIPVELYSEYRMKLDKDHKSYVVQNKRLEEDIKDGCSIFDNK